MKLAVAGALSDEDVRALTDACKVSQTVAMRRDLVRQGEDPNHVHLILEGWACRYQQLENGNRQITAFLLPGDFCDTHITLFSQMDHSIGTVTECKVARISRATIDELTARPGIARAFWWAGLVDEAVLRAWIVNLGSRNGPNRLAHLLCEIYARLANVGRASNDELILPLTQEELGDALGQTSVHVNRSLRKLAEAKFIAYNRHSLQILDFPALKTMAGFDPSYLHIRDRSAALPLGGSQARASAPRC
jgi:CRP-like cAMP-binding protein